MEKPLITVVSGPVKILIEKLKIGILSPKKFFDEQKVIFLLLTGIQLTTG